MYNVTKVSHINNDIYNIKIQLDKKEQLIKKYGLKEVGEYKEYWINNVQIISNGDTFDFNYFEDIYIEYDDTKKILINEYKEVPCIPFSFYRTDLEEEYYLYKNESNGMLIKLKDYSRYITFEITGNDLSMLENNI